MPSSADIQLALSERKTAPSFQRKHEIYAGPRIQFNFDKIKQCSNDLTLKIQTIKTSKLTSLPIRQDILSIEDIDSEINLLNTADLSTLTDEEELTVEEYKTAFDLAIKLKSIKTSKLTSLSLKQGALSIKEIENEINLLNTEDLSTLTDEEKLTIEEYKAALMIAVSNHLQNNCNLEPPTKPKEKSTAMWIAFYGLMIFEFAPMIFGRITITKLVMSSLMFFIPFDVPLIVWTVLSLGCVLNNLVGNIFFMAPVLLDRLGLASPKKTLSLAKAYELQLEATKAINNKLTTDNDFSSADFHAYAKLAKLFNHQMAILKNNYPAFKNSFFSSVVNVLMGFFSTIHGISNALFTSASMVGGIIGLATGTTLTAAAITASMPLTIALLGTVFVVPTIAMSYYLRMRSTSKALNPEADHHATVKDKLDLFKEKDNRQFDRIHSKKLATEITSETHGKAAINKEIAIEKMPILLLEDIRKHNNSQTILEEKTTINIDKQNIGEGLRPMKKMRTLLFENIRQRNKNQTMPEEKTTVNIDSRSITQGLRSKR